MLSHGFAIGNLLHWEILDSQMTSGESAENEAELVPSKQPLVRRSVTYSSTFVTAPE
jgi:hypothetical protein